MKDCCDVIITREGPIDLYGLGDTIIGSMVGKRHYVAEKIREIFVEGGTVQQLPCHVVNWHLDI
ncbi:hypothetical protein PQ743_02375 [Thermoanaerobacterium thermosaccharolyticum]|uniref:hypothetical protein n=1 Tax=Thermoanaerobacterium thermosaccharolyticum TaxID=1517 RepID=UPI003DA8E545